MSKEKVIVYAVMLTGHGDVSISLIGEEKYNWLSASPEDNTEWVRGQTIDKNCPRFIRKEIWEDYEGGYSDVFDEDYYPSFSKMEWFNDKAMVIRGDYGHFSDISEYTNFLLENSDKFVLVDTFEGYIY